MDTFAKAFLPKFLKEVMTHIPTLALKSMDWKGVLKEIGPMAARLGKKSLDPSHIQSLEKLNAPDFRFTRAPLINNYHSLSASQKKATGESILRFYFSQLKNEEGLNLDLRPKHFRREDGKISFSPNNVWFSFKPDFRMALIDLYHGFYLDKSDLYDSALERIGLTRSLSDKESAELKNLFRDFFSPSDEPRNEEGKGDQEKVVFELNHFKESFYQLFKFFMDHEVTLDKDFMFLGIYLVGLYMNLEELKVPLNVRDCFLQVFRDAGREIEQDA